MQVSLCRNILLVVIGAAVLSHAGFSQETDYIKAFGDDWNKAESLLAENSYWMADLCEKFDIDFRFAVALVFPELVRYSTLRDRIEISLLKTLYVNLGEEYADFSIGPFQMKPSFAEKVLEGLSSVQDRKLRNQFRKTIQQSDPKQFRGSVVSDLGNMNRQFIYLIAFIKICELSYPGTCDAKLEKLRLFATVYNCGLSKSPEFIISMLDKKYFSNKLIRSETWSYCDISVFWYKNNPSQPVSPHQKAQE